MAKKAASPAPIELPVRFGNVNIGAETVSIGISISRSNLSPTKADATLCGRRLTGQIISVPNGVDPGQKPLPGMQMEQRIRGVFDVKRIGMTRKAISAPLSFSLEGLDVESLAYFAKRDGRLLIEAIADGASDDADSEDTD